MPVTHYFVHDCFAWQCFLETICFSPVKSNSLTPVKTQFVFPFKSRKSEKNPEFLTQVASLCKKEDPSIVVKSIRLFIYQDEI